MLTSESWVDAGNSHLTLHEDEECSHVFADFLRFDKMFYCLLICLGFPTVLPFW